MRWAFNGEGGWKMGKEAKVIESFFKSGQLC